VTSLSPEVQGIAHRLARLDRAHPTTDHEAVEAALRAHLRECGLIDLPILWAADAEDGYGGAALGRANRTWRGLFGEIERKAHNYGIDGVWQARAFAWPLAWQPAETVMTDMIEHATMRRLGKTRRPSGTAASGAVRALGWIAASAMNPRRIMWLFVERCLSIYRPFIAAYEAGLWLFWVLDDSVLAVARPALRTVDGQLHCDDGPAVAWPDGASYFFWRGVRVPAKVILAREQLTGAEILAERNVESQRIMLERFGYDRLILETGAEPLHADEFGVLYRIRLSRRQIITLVHVVNATPEPDGTRRRYFLRVPPNVRTAHEAVAWTFRLQPEEYRPTQES
jgi:uncharacterized protein DUF6745